MKSRQGGGRVAVDWAELRRRMDGATRSAAGTAKPDEETVRSVLEGRARLLARPTDLPASHATLVLLTLTLGGEAWGIEARVVWDVFKVAELAMLPGPIAPVVGLTVWRGTILSALDLRSVLGMPAAPLADRPFGIVVGADRPSFCVLVDGVSDLVSVDEDDVVAPPEGVAVRREHVLGVTASSLPVLDVARLVERYG